jgi:hypothetical protein
MLVRCSLFVLLAAVAMVGLSPAEPDATTQPHRAATRPRRNVLPFLGTLTHIRRPAPSPQRDSWQRPRGGIAGTLVATARESLAWWAATLTPKTVAMRPARRQTPSAGVAVTALAAARGFRVQGGRIHTSGPAAATLGLPSDVVAVVTNALAIQPDLEGGLPAGAFVRVAYDANDSGVPERPVRQIVAARVTVAGTTHEAFCLTTGAAGSPACYTRDGVRLGRGFLRYPVSPVRVTSGFSTSRYHPVLRRWTPHWGVDFAAPHGTPVHAVAAGVVERTGWRGSSGLTIRIRHDQVYASIYAHLSRIAPGVEAGATVREGQLIGHVGSTGRTTGPHLHFAMHRNGAYFDPLGADLPFLGALAGRDLAAFRALVQRVDTAFADRDAESPRLAAG